jgi:hypothetical protein
MSPESFLQHRSEFVIRPAVRFLGQHALAVVLISALLVIPCFWHTHIQAGDLGSHVYNAWLAQLIEHHQVTGLVIVRQWSNVLFDLLLLGVGNLIGLVGAEKVVVLFFAANGSSSSSASRSLFRVSPRARRAFSST